MTLNTTRLEAAWTARMLSILRIMSALLFLQHGTQKLVNFPAAEFMPSFPSLFWFAGAIEIVGGTLLALGLFTRPVAFILSGQMAVAYFMAHASRSFFPIENGGDAAVLYCFVFLFIAVAGGGAWLLDRLRQQSAGRAPATGTACP